jgi:hypothetical protein
VTVAAVLALALALANTALYVAGEKVPGGARPGWVGIVAFAVLMLTTSVGMWRARYWAVLAFEALLGLGLLSLAIYLTRASSVKGLAIALAGLALGGWLFYKLIRAMARIQMPPRPGT